MGVTFLSGPEWEHADDISAVPVERWGWFLVARVGNWRVKEMAGSARLLLNNLRIIRDTKGWTHLGFKNWVETLADFGLTETTWAWLEASEPILLPADSARQGIEKGRSRVAAEMVIKKGISQTEAAKRVGVTRQAVNKALSTENPQCGKEVDVPDHIAANKNSKTDFLKLSVAGQQKVRDGQPLNRVALAEGVRVKPTLIERARKLYLGMSEDEKRTFLKWAMTTEGGQV